MGFRNFDAHFAINLAKRPDRLRDVLAMYAAVNVTAPTIVHGVPHEGCGALGCSLSWVLALEECINTNGTTCMIVEDDFMLAMNASVAGAQVDALFASDLQWDVVMLSGRALKFNVTRYGFVRSIQDARTTSGFAITRAYAAVMRDNVLEGALWLNENCRDIKHMIDEHMNRLVDAGDMWYMFEPRLGFQKPSYSNIAGGVVNYTAMYGTLV